MIITEIQYFFSKIIRFQAIFKDTVEFTCALEFKISSQRKICDKIISYSGSSADADERCGKITGLGRELQEMKLWKQHRRKTNMK